jgi:hypothetical protein
MQQLNSNKANAIIVAAPITQVDVGRNAGETLAKRMLGACQVFITHNILAV